MVYLGSAEFAQGAWTHRGRNSCPLNYAAPWGAAPLKPHCGAAPIKTFCSLRALLPNPRPFFPSLHLNPRFSLLSPLPRGRAHSRLYDFDLGVW